MAGPKESEAAIGYGATYGIGDGASPETYRAIAEAVNIVPPGVTVEDIDITHLQSPERFREFVASVKSSTDVTFTCNATKQNVAVLFAQVGITQNMRITSNAEIGKQWKFRGYVKEIAYGELSIDDRLTIDVTVKVKGSSGLSDYTPESPDETYNPESWEESP